MQVLMELLGAGLLIFLVVKGVQAAMPKKEIEVKKDPQSTTTKAEQE